MTYIRIENEETYLESRHSGEQYGDWYESKSHNVNGFTVVDEGSYFDLTVPYDVDTNKSYYLVYVEYSTGDSLADRDWETNYLHQLQ